MEPDPKQWNCALNLLIESLERPDAQLRNRAKGAGCYDELMAIRDEVEAWVRTKRLKED